MAQIFISYSREDETFARRLATDVCALGADIWIDVDDIPAGMKWSTAVQQGLDTCDVMLVIVSPHAMKSKNVEDEWQSYLDENKPVIPVLARPTRIHYQLRRIQYVDFHAQPYAVALQDLHAELARQGIALAPPAPPQEGADLSLRKPGTGRPFRLPRLYMALGVAAALTIAAILLALSGVLGGESSSRGSTPETGFSPTPIPAGSRNANWQPVAREINGISMVYVPAGCFVMGSEQGDPDERPAHEVCLSAYWIGRTEVTNAQYQACVDAGACTLPRDPAYYDDATAAYPVTRLDWNQARSYVEWIGAALPTEAQWEYAARGPEGWTYPWGNTFDGARLNFCDANCTQEHRDPAYDDGQAQAAPGGDYSDGASWAGALDMAGNALEWTATWYGAYPAGPQTDPTGQASGELRVARGGGWNDGAEGVRSAFRLGFYPVDTEATLGLRIVVTAPHP